MCDIHYVVQTEMRWRFRYFYSLHSEGELILNDGIAVVQNSRNVLTVEFDGITAGWEHWCLLTADRHHDNPQCNRELEQQQLEKAKGLGASIFDFGDIFCAMQGKYDPRKELGDIRREDDVPYYLDSIVGHAAEFYTPYAENFMLIGHGNHETAIQDRCGTDLVSRLIHEMNRAGGRVYHGFYGGWVRFQFKINKTVRRARNMKYHHGSGGGGPVTRGVIQTNRQAVYLPDASIVVNGHTHDAWIVPIKRERLSRKGTLHKDLLYFIRTPGYKDEYADGADGWWNRTWKPPKPLGCIWMKFFQKPDREIGIEFVTDLI